MRLSGRLHVDSEILVAGVGFEPTTATLPLPLDRDSPHRSTVESPESKHLAGVVQW